MILSNPICNISYGIRRVFHGHDLMSQWRTNIKIVCDAKQIVSQFDITGNVGDSLFIPLGKLNNILHGFCSFCFGLQQRLNRKKFGSFQKCFGDFQK